ncbi:MAG: ferredoxin [Luteolibacter sp.]
MSSSYPAVKSNVAGRFFVDESCIYCELCVETAPENFAFDSNVGCAFVKKQPETDDEELHVLEAIAGCPTESIGDRLDSKENLLDDYGLGKGTTPTSIGGALVQIVARWLMRK